MGKDMKCEILLVPVGTVPAEVCDWLASGLPVAFNCDCSIAPALPHPFYAWDARRKQYQAEPILAQVQKCQTTYALAMADLDLCVPDLNFIFGLADYAGARAIIALPRMRQGFYHLPEDAALFRARVIKEAVHELGHVLGLSHCRDRRCVMAFSNSLADTDYKGQEFCERCRKQLTIGN